VAVKLQGASFSAQVDYWARKAGRNMLTVVKESASRLADQAQTTINEGGKLPIDTGYLRASFVATVNASLPPSRARPGDDATYTYDGSPIDLTINAMNLGDVLNMGWTANYAGFMEYRYGFMRSAAQNWPVIVRQVTREVQASR